MPKSTAVALQKVPSPLMEDNYEDSMTGSEVASLFDPSSSEGLNEEERGLLTALLSSDDRVDIAIPDQIDQKKLWSTLQVCCRVFVGVRKASWLLKMLIGRSLLVIQDNPEIFQDRGFRSFDAFMSDEEKGLPRITGISRPELYKAKTVAKAMPNISLTEAREVGFTKLGVIAEFTTQDNSDCQAWLDTAKNSTIKELREKVSASQHVIVSESPEEFIAWALTVTPTQKAMFETFFRDPMIQAYCENTTPGGIIEKLIAEAESSDWRGQGESLSALDALPA